LVDIFTEYGYYIVGGGAAAGAIILTFFQLAKARREAKEYAENLKIENEKIMDDKITKGVEKVISHINDKTDLINQKFITTDTVVAQSKTDIENIQDDIKMLEKDFKSLCQTIGKHEYVVDKVFPEYLNLRNSIQSFKEKVNENLPPNNGQISRNTEHDIGEEGFR